MVARNRYLASATNVGPELVKEPHEIFAPSTAPLMRLILPSIPVMEDLYII